MNRIPTYLMEDSKFDLFHEFLTATKVKKKKALIS